MPKAYVNRFLIPIGALSRFLGDLYERPNILPQAKKSRVLAELKKNVKLERLNGVTGVFVGYLIGLIIISVLFWGFQVSYRVKIDETRSLISAHPGQERVAYIKKTNDYLGKIDELMMGQRDQGEVVRTISRLTPTDVVLTGITYVKEEGDIWRIEGVGSREAVLAYHSKLENESAAKSETMPYSNLNNDLENQFVINIIW